MKIFGTSLSASKRDLVSLSLITILVLGIFIPILGVQVGGEDFGGHEILVRSMEHAGKLTLPHFLYHVLLIGMDKVFPSWGLTFDSLIVLLGFEVLLGWILFAIFQRELGATENTKQTLIRITLILALMTIAPILPLALVTGSLHSGDWNFLAITTYHNPTMILLRPLALGLFYLSLLSFRKVPPDARNIMFTAVLVILSTLAKPNYAICLAPALVAAALFRVARHLEVNWKQLLFGLLFPMVVVLGWQFWFTYTQGSLSLSKSHIIFAPLALFPWNYIPLRFLLSILFPLVLLVIYRQKVFSNFPLAFSWLVFFIGAFFTYFIAESGERLKDGNFLWCGQITLFILFVTSTIYLLHSRKTPFEPFGWRQILLWSIFALHAGSGVLWYIGHLTRTAWWKG